ncbi:MAG: hypothetical protein RLZZ216_957 [Cyanobacteriota bacterium]|jgi:hypothetical protein
MSRSHASRQEAKRRREWCLREVAALRPRHELVSVLSREEGISSRQALRYVTEAQSSLVESVGASDRQMLLASMITALQTTVRRALERERHSDVIGAVRLMAELTGLRE